MRQHKGIGANKKIKFDSSDDEQQLPSTAKEKNGTGKNLAERPQLFDGNDSDEKIEDFLVLPQYEGKAGQRVRFKIPFETFLSLLYNTVSSTLRCCQSNLTITDWRLSVSRIVIR